MTLLDLGLSHRVVLLFATFSIVTLNAFGAMASGAKYLTISSHDQPYRAAENKSNAVLNDEASNRWHSKQGNFGFEW